MHANKISARDIFKKGRKDKVTYREELVGWILSRNVFSDSPGAFLPQQHNKKVKKNWKRKKKDIQTPINKPE